MGRQAAVGIALQQGVNITDRPTTMQGMKGMRATTAGVRLVQDSTYFVGVLRGKVNGITEEIAKLQKEIDEHNRDQSQAASMQRKAEELDSEVRKLEGTLADYNIAMDKMRQGTDPADLTRYIREYESKNKAFGNEIDRIFLQVKQEEQQYQAVEQQIEAVYQGNQAKINAMDSGKLSRYQELVHSNLQLQERYQQQVNQADAVRDQIAMLQAQREANTFNADYRLLEEQALKLQKVLQGLEEELEVSKLEPDEMQKRMLAKVRADNAQAQGVDERVRVLAEECRKAELTSEELSAELSDRAQGGNSEKDKYEKLYARDREMSEFIEQFESSKQELGTETGDTQARIVALLEHISQGLDAEQSMPDQEAFAKNREDATFKERQLESSKSTMERLSSQREQRQLELEKVANLDEKIKVELGSLTGKMEAMRSEMGSFDDLDGLREGAQRSKQWLQTTVEGYKQRKASSREQVAGLRRRYEEVRRELGENETHKSLEVLEGRLRKYAQTLFVLSEFVETKGRETEYESLKGGCLGSAGRLNSMAKDAMQHQAQNLSDAPLSGAAFNGGGY